MKSHALLTVATLVLAAPALAQNQKATPEAVRQKTMDSVKKDEKPAQAQEMKAGDTAKATLQDAKGQAVGDVTFEQTPHGVLIKGTLSNLPLLSSFGFTSTSANIRGISFWNADVTGVGLAGIRFNVATGVPEPGTWLMMLLGFGVIGAAMRRRPQEKLLAQIA